MCKVWEEGIVHGMVMEVGGWCEIYAVTQKLQIGYMSQSSWPKLPN